MKIKKFNQYILNESEEPISNQDEPIILEYQAYDIDDNLLRMPTVIHMEHLIDGVWAPEDVSTSKFAQIRNDKENWKLLNDNPGDAFSEFRDNGPRGANAFLEDMKAALSQKLFAPSWNKFIDCLINGHIFSLITARGHASKTLRSGVEYIIYNWMSEGQRLEMTDNLNNFNRLFGMTDVKDPISNYLDHCYYYGVSSPEFAKIAPGGASNPEKGKELAIEMFVKKAHEYSQQVGAHKVQMSFSDDDRKNVEHIEKYMRNELSLKYVMQYNVFDTSDQQTSKRIKITEKKVVSYKDYYDNKK